MKRNILALVLAGTMAFAMTACGGSDSGSNTSNAAGANETSGIYVPGTYTAQEQGFGGMVSVSVTFDENNITDVKIDAPEETPSVGGAATDTLAARAKAANGEEFDAVSGASMTSAAVQSAVADCVQQALA